MMAHFQIYVCHIEADSSRRWQWHFTLDDSRACTVYYSFNYVTSFAIAISGVRVWLEMTGIFNFTWLISCQSHLWPCLKHFNFKVTPCDINLRIVFQCRVPASVEKYCAQSSQAFVKLSAIFYFVLFFRRNGFWILLENFRARIIRHYENPGENHCPWKFFCLQ